MKETVKTLTREELESRLYAIDGAMREQRLVVIIPFELAFSPDEGMADGIAAVTEELVCAYSGGSRLFSCNIADIKEFKCTTGIGCTSIEYRDAAGDHMLCRSDMSRHHEYTAVARRLNIWLESGVFHRDYEKELHRVCEKCGRPLQTGTDICYICVKKTGYVKRLLGIAAPYKHYIIISVLLFFLISGINLIPPYLNRIMVDECILKYDISLIGKLFLVIAGLFGVTLLMRLLSSLRGVLLTFTSNKLIVKLREMVFNKIQQLSLSRISKRTAGDLMWRVNTDTAVISDFLTNDIGNIIEQLVTFIAVGTILFIYDWKLALLVLVPAPVFIIAPRLFWKKMGKRYNRQWICNTKADTILHDIFSGIRVVKAFGMEKYENRRYDAAIIDERNISMKNEQFFAIFDNVIGFFMGAGGFLVLYYFGVRVLGHEISLGEMLQFSTYVSLIYGPLYWIGSIPRRLVRLLTSIVKIFEIIDERVDIADSENAVSISIKGDIQINDISFGYDDTADVLKHVSVHIKPGEMVGIVGKSGVGKSTLTNLVMRLYEVNSGSISIDGVDIRSISQESLRSQIGVVLQETFLFAGTVYDNIAYAKPGASRDEIITAAKAAGAHQFIMKLPDAYNTRVGERGHTLSGGERQRISIARALLHNPRILILDEATASLDTETEKQIQDSLQKLTRDRTTLAIAHRLSTLRNADKLIVLDKGTVAEFGTHEELLRNKGIYYGLVMAQRQMSKMENKKLPAASAT